MLERSWTVGSSPDCDICVDQEIVSGRHCRLTRRGESFLLEDLNSTNGTYVGGERLLSSRIVRRGDPVTLGRSVPLAWPPIVHMVTIGRTPDNDIVVPLDVVSGQHARLEQEGDAVHLIDVGSTNGTAVNDPFNKITRAKIQPTDIVFFGSHRVAAFELFKALPRRTERKSTVMEETIAEFQREMAPAENRAPYVGFARRLLVERILSRSQWLWGLGLSALCAVVILSGPHLWRLLTNLARW